MQDTRQKIRALIESMKEQGDVIFGEIIPLLNEMETLRAQSSEAAAQQDALAAAQSRAQTLEQELQTAQQRVGEHERQLVALSETLAAAQETARQAEANAERDAAATTQKGMTIAAAAGDGAPGASSAEIAAGYGALQYQIEMLDFAAGQQDMIKAVQDGALNFAARAAMFIVKGAQAVAWSGSGFEIDIRNRTVPLGTPNAFQRAFTALRWQQGDGSEASLQQFTRLVPHAWGLFPILVRGKVAALLYVDDGGQDKPIYAAPLAALTRVAGLAIDSQANRDRRMPQAPEKLALVLGGAGAVPPAVEQLLEMEMSPIEPADEPQVESMVESMPAAPPPALPQAAPVPPPVAVAPPPPPPPPPPVRAPVEMEDEANQTMAMMAPPPAAVAPPRPPPLPPAAVAPPPLPPAAPPVAAAAPAPASASASDIPPEEKRMHDDARRYARVLAQEIMLYNAQKVELGRKKNNIYSLLKDEIDKSREAYDRRFKQPQLQNRSYFHDALIQYLCDGNPSSLGV